MPLSDQLLPHNQSEIRRHEYHLYKLNLDTYSQFLAPFTSFYFNIFRHFKRLSFALIVLVKEGLMVKLWVDKYYFAELYS